MLRAVVLKNALHVAELRNGDEEGKKQHQPDHAVQKVKYDQIFTHRVVPLDQRREIERRELIKEDEKPERERDVQGQHPSGEFPLFLIPRTLCLRV